MLLIFVYHMCLLSFILLMKISYQEDDGNIEMKTTDIEYKKTQDNVETDSNNNVELPKVFLDYIKSFKSYYRVLFTFL